MISYSIESDKIIKLMETQVDSEKSEIIHSLVREHETSAGRNDMLEGVAYYDVKNTYISNKKFNEVVIGNETIELENSPNNKRKHGYFRIAVDQKVGYIRNPQFTSEIENDPALESINAVIKNDDFPDILDDWEKGATVKGVEYLHPYIDEKTEELLFVVIPSTQIIPIYDTRFERKLVSALRYYEYTLIVGTETKTLHHVEIYTDTSIEFWEEHEEGKYRLVDTKGHISFNNSKAGETFKSWGEIPLIELKNNTERTSDLFLAKDQIDDYDLHKSIFSNELEDIQESLLHIQGFNITGTSQDEIRAEWTKLKKNIKTLKMIVTNEEDARINSIKQEVAYAAKDSMLDRTRGEIFTMLMALDPMNSGEGNITNVVIRAKYALLDTKSNLMISKLKKSLRSILYFISTYGKITGKLTPFDYKKIEIIVEKNILINETEVITNLIKSGDTLSHESKVAKNPFTDNVKIELERLEKEAKETDEQFNEDVVE